MEEIKATNDLAFKKVLGNDETKDITCGFFYDFYGIQVEESDICFDAPYSIKLYHEIVSDIESGDKQAILRQTIKDISASFKTGSFIAEVQVSRERYFSRRALYYASDRYVSGYNNEDKMSYKANGKPYRYSSLVPVYSLNVMGDNVIHDENAEDDAFHRFELYDVSHNITYSGSQLNIAFLELAKKSGLTKNQEYWRQYFIHSTVDCRAPSYIRRAC